MAIVTLEDAKKHLKIRDALHDTEVSRYLAQAEAAILAYVKTEPAAGDLNIQAAVCYLLANLYWHRGEDLAPENFDREVWDAIGRMLAQKRAPTVV